MSEVTLAQLKCVIDDLAKAHWEHGGVSDIDACEFQEILQNHGVIVTVPATEAHKDEWGEDEMLSIAWWPEFTPDPESGE